MVKVKIVFLVTIVLLIFPTMVFAQAPGPVKLLNPLCPNGPAGFIGYLPGEGPARCSDVKPCVKCVQSMVATGKCAANQLGTYVLPDGETKCRLPSCICTIPDIIIRLTQFIAGVVGSLAVLMFVWAGILFVISGGNEQRVTTAKKTAIWAAIGLAIALAGAGLAAVLKTLIGVQSP